MFRPGLLFYAMHVTPIIDAVGSIILGKIEHIRLALTCLFAGGHLLIEDLPGIGKTTLAKAMAKSLGLKFRRLQFTSDMLPGDVLGVSVFDQKNGNFIFHPGPVFTEMLLVDEINRATPKTQSALLEAMEERQVTIEGETRLLSAPFFVIATQNPIEHAGTFPLPDSQLDRFLMRISLGYPDRSAEYRMLGGEPVERMLGRLIPLLSSESVLSIQDQVSRVCVSSALLEYLQDLLTYSRNSGHFLMGLSPRAGLALLRATRSFAFMENRDFAIPEDLQHVLLPVVGHRLRWRDNHSSKSREELLKCLMEVPIP